MTKIITPKDTSFRLAKMEQDVETASLVFFMGLTWEKDFFVSCYSKKAVKASIKNQEIWVK